MADEAKITIDLRPWGWAPGDYSIRCCVCASPDATGDKRCWRCEPCAREAKAASVRVSPRIHRAPPFETLKGLQFYAKDSDGRWFYVNHAGEWCGCPPPACHSEPAR